MTTTRSRLRLGSCPDSWGVWFPHDPAQTPWQRFLDELAEAGYRWLELGPYGYLPADPGRLREEVDRRGLRVSGQAVFGGLHDAGKWDKDLAEARRVAELVVAVGNLLQRAKGRGQAAGLLTDDLRRSLAERLGLPPSTPADQVADTVAERTGIPRERVLRTLTRSTPRDEAELVALSQAADTIRREVTRVR